MCSGCVLWRWESKWKWLRHSVMCSVMYSGHWNKELFLLKDCTAGTWLHHSTTSSGCVLWRWKSKWNWLHHSVSCSVTYSRHWNKKTCFLKEEVIAGTCLHHLTMSSGHVLWRWESKWKCLHYSVLCSVTYSGQWNKKIKFKGLYCRYLTASLNYTFWSCVVEMGIKLELCVFSATHSSLVVVLAKSLRFVFSLETCSKVSDQNRTVWWKCLGCIIELCVHIQVHCICHKSETVWGPERSCRINTQGS